MNGRREAGFRADQIMVAEECMGREVWERIDEWVVVCRRQDLLI